MSEEMKKVTESEDQEQMPHPLEKELDVYPLRDPSEDPRWVVRTVWFWVVTAILLLVFFIVLAILGIWYD
jgi:hypothetical protein